MADTEQRLRARLMQDLRVAIKARDGARVAALRTLVAALDNATAVSVEALRVPMPLATAEVARKVLTDEDVRSILLREIAERHEAASTFETHGRSEAALGLRTEIAIFEAYAAEFASGSRATEAQHVHPSSAGRAPSEGEPVRSEDSGHEPRGAG